MCAASHRDYVEANRANWDSRAAVHAASAYYDLDRYVADPDYISSVVDWDRTYLGDVRGLDLLHLQCHIGTDTLSWARLGANVVGLDISPKSLEVASDLARRTGTEITYVCGDVREADSVVGCEFDLVYTSVGALCWIPDVRQWARAVAACVKPGGRFFIRDDHPVLATLDPAREDAQLVAVADYFDNRPRREEAPYTYTGDDEPLTDKVNFQWSHGLGSIVTALIEHGLQIVLLEELDWLDWQPFPWMIQGQDGRWRFPPGHPRLPLAFALLASKPLL